MNWFLQNPLLANPVVKPWVKVLLQHKDTLERTAGGRLGEVLGCGHWGCVVDLVDSPWVLKLTVDPTEAHVWSKVIELMEEEVYGQDGFPRFKKLFRLEPGIPYGKRGRVKIAYGIVREKVAPVFKEGPYGVELTDFSKQYLGLAHLTTNVPVKGHPELWQAMPMPVMYERLKNKAITGLDERTQNKVDEFVENIEAVKKYREAALGYHQKPKDFPKFMRGGYSLAARDEWKDLAERATHRMGGPIGGALGESLGMLLSNEVILNDVHVYNLGWRFLTSVGGQEGYTCLVIFDPGHTPTDKRPLPAEKWQQLAALG